MVDDDRIADEEEDDDTDESDEESDTSQESNNGINNESGNTNDGCTSETIANLENRYEVKWRKCTHSIIIKWVGYKKQIDELNYMREMVTIYSYHSKTKSWKYFTMMRIYRFTNKTLNS